MSGSRKGKAKERADGLRMLAYWNLSLRFHAFFFFFLLDCRGGIRRRV